MNMPIVGCIGESIIGSDERGLWFPVSYTHLTLPTNREV